MEPLTLEELKAIEDALTQLTLDGFAEDDSDPIVTALNKVTAQIHDIESDIVESEHGAMVAEREIELASQFED